MSLLIWTGLFSVYTLFAIWVLFLRGAERLEGSFVSLLVVSSRAANWTSDGIRFFVGLSWIVCAIWFVIGIFDLDVRRWIVPS